MSTNSGRHRTWVGTRCLETQSLPHALVTSNRPLPSFSARVHRSARPLGLAAVLSIASACSQDAESTEASQAPLCTDAPPASAPLRRLNRFEYGRTLADVLEVDAALADQLPPDEQSLGYDNNADAYSISSAHALQYLAVAEAAAAAYSSQPERLATVASCDPRSEGRACVEAFVSVLGRRLWRRPLESGELADVLAVFDAAGQSDATAGISAALSMMLQAPQFLYRVERVAPTATNSRADDHALASRLSYLLTASAPDDQLLHAAESGALQSDEELLAHGERLLNDPRAADVFARFVFQWWELDALSTLEKDGNLIRHWSTALQDSFMQETNLFLRDIWTTGPTVKRLLTEPQSFVDARLATFYGVNGEPSSGFVKVALDPARSAGLLTQGSFLATHAKANQTSPVLRGKFVRVQLLCDPPPPPPADIVIRPPRVDPRLSTRERFAEHSADPGCASCHKLMDPLGLVFEHYDAAGRWRDTDANKPVDASGELTRTDVDGDVNGVRELAERLGESDQVLHCAATQWFRFAFGRSEQSEADRCTIDALSSELKRSRGDLRALMHATLRAPQFRNAAAPEQP